MKIKEACKTEEKTLNLGNVLANYLKTTKEISM